MSWGDAGGRCAGSHELDPEGLHFRPRFPFVAGVTYDPAKTTPSAIAKAITDGSGFKADVDSEKDR